ncbi:MAG: bifunctional phosphopantothenoylcysteine decarboxylase/phosphopantothenate--cysteine ligase CoaBC [Alphaproteobacteria bacterium]|nr:bifunctional phosphopantothenoylcysteine decarboxylase/phosphopantothenate--cysteine ligase CoaBC [Alphaproteobacteria bacterium]
MQSLEHKSILLIITGGIAAYKALELVRLLKKNRAHVRCVLTKGGEHFVTPLSLAALSEETVYTDLWSLKDETEMGHIRLSREADLIVIAPASADFIARTACGLAGGLAGALLLAADKPVLLAPAMHHKMWLTPATQAHVQTLKQRGFHLIGPVEGDMACGEYGPGRMSEPPEILQAIQGFFGHRPLSGKTALVTSGPTFEPIDPVRFIGNRSSGKQGHAIAAALAALGAQVTLVSGPVALPDPPGVKTHHVETAVQMLKTCEDTLNSAQTLDIAVCAAAVSDWRPETALDHKIKKRQTPRAPELNLTENPDILKTIAHANKRPALVIGFAAETENLEENARNKRTRKGCDWLMANLVGQENAPVFGENHSHVYLLRDEKTLEDWGVSSKTDTAQKLAEAIAVHFSSDFKG